MLHAFGVCINCSNNGCITRISENNQVHTFILLVNEYSVLKMFSFYRCLYKQGANVFKISLLIDVLLKCNVEILNSVTDFHL